MWSGEQDGGRERGTGHSQDGVRRITFYEGIGQLHLNRTAGISVMRSRVCFVGDGVEKLAAAVATASGTRGLSGYGREGRLARTTVAGGRG